MSDVDLHCHSSASDGLLPPTDVVRRAAGNGAGLLALTDHDTLGGLAEARQAAEAQGVRLVSGVEISIEWGGMQVHVLGYNFAPDDVALNAGLLSIRSGRIERAQRMSEALATAGIPGCLEGALRHAENQNLISRAHFARYLVECGVCKDVRSVFESYLVPGRPGYVDHRWPTLQDAVAWVVGAGGLAAIAHPGRYKLARAGVKQLLDEFKACGGMALEVVSGSHSADNVTLFARLAKAYGFFASCGSDFHGPGESYIDVGKVATLPDGVRPVWEAF